MPSLITQKDLTKKVPYAGIPTPVKDLDALFNTTLAMQEVLETLIRQRGKLENSVLTYGETERIIEGVRFDIARIENILNIVYKVSIEEAIMTLSTTTAFANGATIAPYQTSKPIDSEASVTEDLVAGTLTIGKDGWYTVSGYIQATGASFNNYYGAILDINAGADPHTLGVSEWINGTPQMAFFSAVEAEFSAGDVVKIIAYSQSGNLTVTDAHLSIEMESLP
jgi:hypothetical protein